VKLSRSITITILILVLMAGCSNVLLQESKSNPAITKTPSEFDFGRGKLSTIPSYDKFSSSTLQVDLRSFDLSSLYMKDRYSDLIHADFDTRTIWPYGLPGKFNPKKIIEYGKNPGLNIRQLHKKGITGKGVNIAVIGEALLVNHAEFKDRLKLYEEIHCLDKTATVNGCAEVSVVAGEKTGVASGANIYYIADTPGNYSESGLSTDFSWLVLSINRVLEINKKLIKGNKIKVLLIGYELTPEEAGYEALVKTIEKAKKQGIFVISNSIYETYDHELDFNGLGREPLADPDKLASYGPSEKWASNFFMFERYTRAKEVLLVPMDSRSTASPTGKKDYAFYNKGNLSLSAAYVAGLYALACQKMTTITPQLFWNKALETGDTVKIKNSNIDYEYKLKKLVNPVKLIDELKK